MREPKQLIEECKKHLRDTEQYKHEYKKDIRKLITALEKAITVTHCCMGEAEQLFCDCEIPKPTDPYDVVDKHICRDCKQIIAK
jgi:hypothetical protein